MRPALASIRRTCVRRLSSTQHQHTAKASSSAAAAAAAAAAADGSTSVPTELVLYLDFISPYAYFAHSRLTLAPDHPRAFFRQGVLDPSSVKLTYRPVLFAGLLKHWGNLGPAEIASKRVFTYEFTHWLGRQREGLPDFKFPHSHPFNSLPLLRAAVACVNSKKEGAEQSAAIQRIFRFVWADGHIPTDKAALVALLSELGLEPSSIEAAQVKEGLRQNTELAVADGVFGVPTLVMPNDRPPRRRLFWGLDAVDFAREYLVTKQQQRAACGSWSTPSSLFDDPDFTRLADLPMAASRVPIKGA